MNVGTVSYDDTNSYAASGPIARGSGVPKDLRLMKADAYSFYFFLTFRSFLGKRGDSYDRFLIRMREMGESINIIFQIIASMNFSNLNPGRYQFKLEHRKMPKSYN